MRATILALALLLTACESMSPYEKAWQAMHLVDVAQTLNGPVSDPCYREAGLITSRVVGEQPSAGALLAWSVGYAVAHYYAWQWIDDRDWPDGLKTFLRSIDLANKGIVIANNHAIGVRPFGDNRGC